MEKTSEKLNATLSHAKMVLAQHFGIVLLTLVKGPFGPTFWHSFAHIGKRTIWPNIFA